MISSKLILFFCFYLLLLLDNSLGQKSLVTQVGNKELFKHAIDFGATFGGLLGLLGSQWKQLLIQLVHAKRNVGFDKYQLARFNDSATTEEVGLATTDNYADKVAELVAVRVQDIGSTQKYIDDLEILKNEIALTMIVEMDELEKKLKEKNVRKKVKEAKENGLTDTDIKEILFAEFIDSGGVSLIRAGASTPDALLSSFRSGLESLVDETYDKELGIIQYGNVLGCLPFGNCFGKGNNDEDNNDAGGGGGGQGGAPGGSGSPGGFSGGGGDDEPPGGGDRPPYFLPNGTIGDEDDQEPNNDTRIDEDVDEFFERFMASLPAEILENNPTLSPEDLENWLLNQDGAGLGVEEVAAGPNEEEAAAGSNEEEDASGSNEEEDAGGLNEEGGAAGPNEEGVKAKKNNTNTTQTPIAYVYTPFFFPRQLRVTNERVEAGMNRRRAQIAAFENELRRLRIGRRNGYFRNESLREPSYYNLNDAQRQDILNTRIASFRGLLNRTEQLSSNLREYRIAFQRNYYRARDNFYFYANLVGFDLTRVPANVRQIYEPLSPLPDFRNDITNEQYRYLIARLNMLEIVETGMHLQYAAYNCWAEIRQIQRILLNDKARLDFYTKGRPWESYNLAFNMK